MFHDPRELAHIAAVILSATGQVEPHHIKAAVDAARSLLAEAHRRVDEDGAAVEARHERPASEPEPVEKIKGGGGVE